MDRRNAFERQLSAEIEHEVGPPLPVDALAITRAAMTATRRWRFRTMFSAIASAATVVVFAAGSVLFLSQPAGPPEGVSPGAETGSTPTAAYVHGYGVPSFCCVGEVTTYDDDGNRVAYRDSEGGGMWTFDDPRLTGTFRTTGRMDEFPSVGAGERVEFYWSEIRVENEEGAWSGTQRGTWDSSQPVETGMGIIELTGEGAYQGLSAILFEVQGEHKGSLAGAIFPGPLPPLDLDTAGATE